MCVLVGVHDARRGARDALQHMRADYACGAALRRRAYGIPGVAQHLCYVAELSCVSITNTFNEIQMLSLSLTVSSLALALAVLPSSSSSSSLVAAGESPNNRHGTGHWPLTVGTQLLTAGYF